MAYGRVTGVSILGVSGRPIVVEAHVGRGLPSLIRVLRRDDLSAGDIEQQVRLRRDHWRRH